MQVKLWVPGSGSCFVTFSAHTAPVTALAFLRHSAAVVSASLDGTVRAWDLLRYRNFRTMTSPTPVQFNSLAVDPAGEVRPLFWQAVLLRKLLCNIRAAASPTLARLDWYSCAGNVHPCLSQAIPVPPVGR